VVVELQTDRGTLGGIEVELIHRGRVLATRHLGSVGYVRRTVVLRVRAKRLAHGHYAIVVRQGHRPLARRTFTVR
jgi:hypothetical protein